jgi:hypothetical protein
MNSRQLVALWVGILIAAYMVWRPPLTTKQYLDRGPVGLSYTRTKVVPDFSMLSYRLAVVAAITGATILSLRSKKQD